MPRTVTTEILDAYVGKEITDICEVGYDARGDNHCAHFVSHALQLRHGFLCTGMKHGRPEQGATLRCNDLFNALAQRGPWDEAPGQQDGILIFITTTGNMTGLQMGSYRKKHVGIVFGGKVYNYGNTEDRVRAEATVDSFKTRLGHAYGGMNAVSFYYAVPA